MAGDMGKCILTLPCRATITLAQAKYGGAALARLLPTRRILLPCSKTGQPLTATARQGCMGQVIKAVAGKPCKDVVHISQYETLYGHSAYASFQYGIAASIVN
ncbi:hypothetical protein UNDYM_3760 [Undibacterium sp. YM2]|nr:hypothetical protein UNDYM_3760 [Undibacterium sp. YM2]